MTDIPTPIPSASLAPADIAHPKTIRSFVRRAGRTTSAQTRAFADLGPQFLLPYQPGALDFGAAFANPAGATAPNDLQDSPGPHPVVLEIGFGMGEATAHIAALMPHTHFLCCEVHTPGVGALLKRIDEQGL
ncbi:MAG: hypothetical protein Q7K20_07300, partial [Polaromonas sp.]|nr:hypothetical protein [Polaromonas sp.]